MTGHADQVTGAHFGLAAQAYVDTDGIAGVLADQRFRDRHRYLKPTAWAHADVVYYSFHCTDARGIGQRHVLNPHPRAGAVACRRIIGKCNFDRNAPIHGGCTLLRAPALSHF